MNLSYFKTGAAVLISVIAAATSLAQIADFSEDFENVDPTSPSAVSDLGYVVFGNVFTSNFDFCYGYGIEPAPNSTNEGIADAFSGIESNVGAGQHSLNIFSDYQNGDHDNLKIIQANVFREVKPVASDVGAMVTYQFDYRRADAPNGPTGSSETFAFIRIIDQFNGFALVDEFLFDTTAATTSFQTGSITVEIDPFYFNDAEGEGLLFQYGFFSFCTSPESAPQGSGIYYDNVSLTGAANCFAGDVNGDGNIDLLDVGPFVDVLTSGDFICEADANQDGSVDLLDVGPFVFLLSGG